MMTYREIGAFLSPRIHAGSWDAAVVGRLADYLKRQDPTLRGYGKSNLYNMAKVYDAFSTDAFATLNERHQRQLTAGLDFSQLPTGKSDVVRRLAVFGGVRAEDEKVSSERSRTA